MDEIKYNRKYPFTIKARYFHLYTKRKCPCITVFCKARDQMSFQVIRSVVYMSKKYPTVFCYKTGWDSLHYYYQNVGQIGCYDVIVWRENKRLMFFSEPTLEQLNMLFRYAYDLTFNKFYDEYIKLLKKEPIIEEEKPQNLKNDMENLSEKNSSNTQVYLKKSNDTNIFGGKK